MKFCSDKHRRLPLVQRAAGWLLVAVVGSTQLFACGPFFPNSLIGGGDGAVLTAPVAWFAKELTRVKLPPSKFKAINAPHEGAPSASEKKTTLEADVTDLRAALRRANTPANRIEEIVGTYHSEREKLFRNVEQQQAEAVSANDPQARRQEAPVQLETVNIPAGLPGEFADYSRGAIQWHSGNKPGARAAWSELLARPPGQRHFKSVWAAYMIAKCWEAEAPAQAPEYYRRTRELVAAGFADTLGLAAESIGWEAHAELQQRQYYNAMLRYLDFAATGAEAGPNSLLRVAEKSLAAGPETLEPMARHPQMRQVITMYLISREADSADTPENTLRHANIRDWLAAVERARVNDVELAERLALAAYQANEIETAARWIARSANSPISQWLKSKLLLREGRVKEAAAVLAKVTRRLPVTTPENGKSKSGFQNSLYVTAGEGSEQPHLAPAQQALGELGMVRLTRREYTEALDALFRSGYWRDAAYVAERVLTLDELKTYVDRHWPEPKGTAGANESQSRGGRDRGTGDLRDADFPPTVQARQIRHLLARRLTRSERGREAGVYYPPDWRIPHADLMAQLRSGQDGQFTQVERGRALFAAACLVRTNGMELIGTELEPDWAVFAGDFELEPVHTSRTGTNAAVVLKPSTDEVRRTQAAPADPDVRFHYRYRAASLAFEAAQWMPDNNDETARMLHTAGLWLAKRDPKAADVFYKALVRRCRGTALGAEADRLRWFPQ